ncbi:hypothetical protein J3R83DRAFT_13479 [Lanmaoa asiatica]|nr:hypothetical protein J3R83DRAFT_13479 [Lanmaoa asiatica]
MEEDRDDFLHELIHLEGRDGVTACSFCKTGPDIYRCNNCPEVDLYCKACILSRHTSQPIHLIKDSDFLGVARQILDLKIPQGTRSGNTTRPVLGRHAISTQFRILTTLDTNGIHSVALRSSGCEFADTPARQLWRCRLFPATTHSHNI